MPKLEAGYHLCTCELQKVCGKMELKDNVCLLKCSEAPILCYTKIDITKAPKVFTSKSSNFILKCSFIFSICSSFCGYSANFCNNFRKTNHFSFPWSQSGSRSWSSSKGRCCWVKGWCRVGIVTDGKLCMYWALKIKHRIISGHDFWKAWVNPNICWNMTKWKRN